MRRLVRLAPLVAACFVAGVAVPRTTVWRHRHVGGDHAHVHAHGPSPHHEHDAHDHHHHSHHDDAPGTHAGVASPVPGDHAHWQQPFVRADRPSAPLVARIDRIAWLPALHARTPGAPARPGPRSRGPPLA